MKQIYVTTGKEMAQAIRENAGTACEIHFGSYTQTFKELLQSEKDAIQVKVKCKSWITSRWLWIWEAEKEGLLKPTSKRKVPFIETTEELAQQWEKMPKKIWPKA